MADKIQIRLQPLQGQRFAATVCLLHNGLPWNVQQGHYNAQLTSAFLTVASRQRNESRKCWHFGVADLDVLQAAVMQTAVPAEIVGQARFRSPVSF